MQDTRVVVQVTGASWTAQTMSFQCTHLSYLSWPEPARPWALEMGWHTCWGHRLRAKGRTILLQSVLAAVTENHRLGLG
jgi:hypothetical protein